MQAARISLSPLAETIPATIGEDPPSPQVHQQGHGLLLGPMQTPVPMAGGLGKNKKSLGSELTEPVVTI